MRTVALRRVLSAFSSLAMRSSRVLGRMFAARAGKARQKADSEGIRESEARYSGLVTTMQQVVFQTDHEGRFTFLNPAWTRIMGYAVGKSLAELHFSYVHPDDRGRHRALVLKAAEGTGLANYEIRCIAK